VAELAEWDVAVGGSGTGRPDRRLAAAGAGARTVVIERAEHPRYKTCGGGLIGTSLAVAARHMQVPARDRIHVITAALNGRREFTRHADAPLLSMVSGKISTMPCAKPLPTRASR